MICVPLTGRDVKSMVELAGKVDCDLVEVRLDYLKNFDDLRALSKIRKPILATCMPKYEGGFFDGTEEERMRVLRSALPFSRYVSIELKTKKELMKSLIRDARRRKVKVIVTYHNVNKTPSRRKLSEILKKEVEASADVCKIACMPENSRDVFNIISLLVEKPVKKPVIALSMGRLGRISRIAGPLLGGYMTFAAPSRGKGSAPGQLTVDEVKGVLSILQHQNSER